METKQCICLEVKQGESTFNFYMPLGSTWGQAIDASYAILEQVKNMASQSIENSKPKVENAVEPEIMNVPGE